MSSRKFKLRVSRPKAKGAPRRWKRVCAAALMALSFALLTGCRMDMQDQPRYKAYRQSDFFKDGLSSRTLVPGTVPRGYLRSDKLFYTGKTSAAAAQGTSGEQPPGGNQPGAQASGNAAYGPDLTTAFPFPVTTDIVKRGESRYQIFCSVCHGATGYGDGMIVRRGYKQPPSFHTDQLRQAPVGHFFDVITNGWGVMPSYAAQITPSDRWAIVAYIRALQLSQNPQGTPSGASATTQQQSVPQRATTGGQR